MRILIADDHTLFRRGLSLVLAQLYTDLELVEASDTKQAVARIEEGGRLDLALLDLAMPGMEGFAGLRRLKGLLDPAPVIILSAYSDREEIAAAIRAGARGYVLKSSSDSVLRHALSLVLSGEIYLPSSLLVGSEDGGELRHGQRLNLAPDNPLVRLTERQRDTLALLMQGQSNKEIARNLGLLESTVKAHLKVILQKLNASNRTQAALIARELGWPGSERPGF